jgi:uncharacterized protein
MLHQSTELRFVNSEIGYGVFATELIPKGTIIAFQDPLDVEVKPETFTSLYSINVEFRAIIEHFAYVNLEGYGVISWDNVKYTNHSCDFNTLPTGYMLSIAVKDIAEGEEITTDYGLLDGGYEYKEGEHMLCKCGSPNCRKEIPNADPKTCLHLWVSPTNEAFNCALDIKQPLLDFMDSKRKKNLIKSLQSTHDFSQVLLNLIQQREANFNKKWAKVIAQIR